MKPLYSSGAQWLRLLDDRGETVASIIGVYADIIWTTISNLDQQDPTGVSSADYLDGVVEGLAGLDTPDKSLEAILFRPRDFGDGYVDGLDARTDPRTIFTGSAG